MDKLSMKNKIMKIIENFSDYPVLMRVSIYAVVFIFSHFSTSIVYELAMYRYSLDNNFPYIYTKQVPIENIYPSILYSYIPYLVINFILYYGIVTSKMYYESYAEISSPENKIHNFFLRIYDFLGNKVSSSNINYTILKTKDGINFVIATALIFTLFILLDNNSFLQQIGIVLFQFSIPIYFYYKISSYKKYITIFLSIIPILIALSSLTLLSSSAFDRIMVNNRIGGNINVDIFDKVNKVPMNATLLFLSESNIIVDHNNATKILNMKDIGTINFSKAEFKFQTR